MQTPLGSIDNDSLTLPEILTASGLQGEDFTSTLHLPPILMVSAANVRECDSVGIAALLWLLQQAERCGSMVQFQTLPTVITQLLDLYDLHNKELIFDAGTTD